MKKWVEKLVEQFDFDWKNKEGHVPGAGATLPPVLDEERATILFMLDTFNKHLIEVPGHPVRKTREILDEFSREIIQPEAKGGLERVLFRLRQFFGAYRLEENAYTQKTFEDFRAIIWDFVDQLAEDVSQEQKDDGEIRQSLDELKEAVEANSIDSLKTHSRKFIDCYIENQFKKDKRRGARMKSIRKNLNLVKKQLTDAQQEARVDGMTGAFNRKTFDEYCHQYAKLPADASMPVSMIILDIDHFKKINDTYGHQIGDFVIKELVGALKGHFTRESDLICRIGGEEFAVVLPDYDVAAAAKRAEELMKKVRALAYVHEDHQIRFTVSAGIAQLNSLEGENVGSWLKRADWALYHSKNTGRNRATVAPAHLQSAA